MSPLNTLNTGDAHSKAQHCPIGGYRPTVLAAGAQLQLWSWHNRPAQVLAKLGFLIVCDGGWHRGVRSVRCMDAQLPSTATCSVRLERPIQPRPDRVIR
jgi:hypothetical protein